MNIPDILFKQGIIENRHPAMADRLLIILLTLIPFLFMTIKGGLGLEFLLILVLGLFLLWSDPDSKKKIAGMDHRWLMLAALALPILGVLIGEAFRMGFQPRNYDGPSRMLLAIPILLVVFARRIDYARILAITLPPALVVTWIYAAATQGPRFGDRLTVTYSDPILWGGFAMVHGFICLFSIRTGDSTLRKCYLYAGLATGIAMSVISQSRGGWIAAMALSCIWLWINRKSFKFYQLALAILALILSLTLAYFAVDIVHLRINEVFVEAGNWMSGSKADTSTGLRLTFWKMGLYLFSQRPFAGYGDHGLLPYLNDPYLLSFASAEAVSMIQNAGPHNEFIADLLRSGVFGFFSYAGKYFIPLYVFVKIYAKNDGKNLAALQGICLVAGCMVSSMSIEVLSYKHVYVYYAATVAALMGSAALSVRSRE